MVYRWQFVSLDFLGYLRSVDIKGISLLPDFIFCIRLLTRAPKGVVVTQISAVNLVNWVVTFLHPNRGSRILQLTSICFDISVWELFSPLVKGDQLILAPSSVKTTGFPFLTLLRQEITAFS